MLVPFSLNGSWARLLLLAPLMAAAGPSGADGSAGPAGGPDARYARTEREFIDSYLDWRPQLATSLGLHRYDGRITDFSAGSVAAELARLKQFDTRLAAFEPAQLTRVHAYDLRILRSAVLNEIFQFEGLRVYTDNPMTYAGALDVSIYVKRDFAPLSARVASLTRILEHAPDLIAAAHTNLAASLPRPFVETAILVARGSESFLEADLVEALKDFPEGPEKAAFRQADQRAVAQMRSFADWLEKERLPDSNDRWALGAEKYAQMLKYSEMIPLSPAQILAIGDKQLAAEQARFVEAGRIIDSSKPAAEVFKSIQKDHPTAAGLIPDTRASLEKIRQFVIDHSIIEVPSAVRASVEETPAFARATSSASMDTPGPFETGATAAYYYVTPVEPTWSPERAEEWLTSFNDYTAEVVSIHEAYPGHYIQFLHLNQSSATEAEKIFGSYAFIEGWAHYCEQMMIEEGYGASDPVRTAKYRMAQSSEALLRLCRLCVSIRMHCYGMTVEEGTRFFHEHCYYETAPAHDEAMRGTFDPGYLFYTLGKLQFLKLREDWKRQEGPAYSLRRFNNAALAHGMPPLRLLREQLLKNQKIYDDIL